MTRSKKISQLEENGTLTGTDVIPVSNQEGTNTFKLSMDKLVDYMDDNANFNPTIVSDIRTDDFSIDSTTTQTIFLIDATSSTVIVDLENHTKHVNRVFIFKRMDNSGLTTDNTVEIRGTGASTIDGQIEYLLMEQYQTLTIVGSNHGWLII